MCSMFGSRPRMLRRNGTGGGGSLVSVRCPVSMSYFEHLSIGWEQLWVSDLRVCHFLNLANHTWCNLLKRRVYKGTTLLLTAKCLAKSCDVKDIQHCGLPHAMTTTYNYLQLM